MQYRELGRTGRSTAHRDRTGKYSSASKGVIARRHPYNYEMGLHLEKPIDFPKGLITENVFASEQNQRHFYGRWADFMDAASWDGIPR